MPFTTPSTVTASTPATAVWANEQVRDNVKWLATDKPHARVNNNAATSIPNSGVWTPINFAAEQYNVGSMHSTSATVQGDGFPLNTRLVIPTGGGGVYHIGATALMASASGGISIKRNGTTYISQGGINTVGGLVSCEYALAAGDYLQVGVSQTSGGAVNVIVSADISAGFWATWVST